MTSTALIEHALPGRTRFRVPSRRRDADFFAQVATALGGLEGVQQVATTPISGSVLIYHRAPVDTIVAFAREQGLFQVAAAAAPSEAPSRPLAVVLGEWLDQVDFALHLTSQGRSSLEELTLGGLLLAVMYQFLKGRSLPPAVTLLRYANDLVERPSENR
jgi:hypothetical protein